MKVLGWALDSVYRSSLCSGFFRTFLTHIVLCEEAGYCRETERDSNPKLGKVFLSIHLRATLERGTHFPSHTQAALGSTSCLLWCVCDFGGIDIFVVDGILCL